MNHSKAIIWVKFYHTATNTLKEGRPRHVQNNESKVIFVIVLHLLRVWYVEVLQSFSVIGRVACKVDHLIQPRPLSEKD